jgi:hypothetical protein
MISLVLPSTVPSAGAGDSKAQDRKAEKVENGV